MKYAILLGIFFLTAINSSAQDFEWAHQLGASSNDEAASVATDAAGNVYTTGYFQNTVDFDPGTDTYNLTAFGGYDIYVSKLSASGNFLWAKQFGGQINEEGSSITVDNSGDIYFTGYFQGTADFDPGVDTLALSSNGGYDIFISKLDASGNFLWAKQIGGNGVDNGQCITTDIEGNVYTTGYFRNTTDFDPGEGIFELTSVGNRDVFTSKLDASGNFIWAKQTGGISLDNGFSITTDVFGNVFTTGGFQDSVDFDPGVGVSNLISAGLFDIYVSKLDSEGEFLWAKRFGGVNTDIGTSLTTDAVGNVYTTGYFTDTLDFDPGEETFNLISPENNDIFISKLDASGEFVWAKQMGGTEDDRGFSISSDSSGNLYTTGMFENTADFDPGNENYDFSSNGEIDIFISKLDDLGEFVWALQLGGPGNDFGNGITADETGNNIYTTGFFENTVDFNTEIGILNLTSAGGDDSFIHKLNQCEGASRTEVVMECESFTWLDGITYFESTNNPTFNIPGVAANGCDSLITLDLTINNIAINNDIVNSCGPYTWLDGNLYTESTNIPSINIPGGAANGCDSLIILDLTINNNAIGTDTITACNSYTWLDGISYSESIEGPTFNIEGGTVNGCDSLVTLNLTIHNSASGIDFITACDSYTWLDGNSYTESTDIPTFNIEGGAANGCDSLVTLNLTVNSVSDLSISADGATISANNSNATYQWLDCDDNFNPIPEETNQSYTSTVNGFYAVELTENGCVETSECVNLIAIGIAENTFGEQFTIYPNPTQGEFSLDLGDNYKTANISVSDLNGKLIQSASYTNAQFLNLELLAPVGIYMLSIEAADQKIMVRLVKN